MTAVVIALAFLASVAILYQPLRPGRAGVLQARDTQRRADLDAAKAYKYREIHDATLDHRTGKLSEEDWRVIDRRLRAEAVAILHALDALDEARPEAQDAPADADR